MEAAAVNRSNHGANVRRWREWRNINQDVLAEKVGVSQTTLSGYEKKSKLEPEVLEKIAKVLDVPVEAITELNEGASINIFSGTFNDSVATGAKIENFSPSFNPIDKVVELYDKLLQSEKDKVAMLEEMLKSKK